MPRGPVDSDPHRTNSTSETKNGTHMTRPSTEDQSVEPRWAVPALFWDGPARTDPRLSPDALLERLGDHLFPCYRSLQENGAISTAGDHHDRILEDRKTAMRFWADTHAACGRYPWQLRVRLRDHPHLVDYARSLLMMYRKYLPRGPEMAYSAIWFAGAGSRTPLHQDSGNGILVQLTGNKLAHLFEPDSLSVEEGSKLRDSREVLSSRGRELLKIRGYFSAALAGGTALYIPRGWHHDVECITPSISLVLRE